jgi:hypothetical protein
MAWKPYRAGAGELRGSSMSLPQPESARNPPIRTYPCITAAAIRAGFPAAARLYDLIQHFAATNNGCAFFSRAGLVQLGVIDQHAIDRALKEGAGFFWTWTGRNWHMTARSKVAAGMGVENPGKAVGLSVETLAGRLSKYKAHVYAAYLAQLRTPIRSRAFLCEQFGVTIPTLLEWERQTGVQARPRFVQVEPFDGVQEAVYSQSMEVDDTRTRRVWIHLVTHKGRIVASRRLMDNDNQPLDDYHQTLEAPAWENNANPVLVFQISNEYASPLDTTSGRWRRLSAEIKRLIADPDSPAARPGGKSELEHARRARWFDDRAVMVKWQGKRQNRGKPAAIQTQRSRGRVIGAWSPSREAFWGEV